MYKKHYFITLVITLTTLSFQGCQLFYKQQNIYLEKTAEGINITKAVNLAEIQQYQQSSTLLTQIKSNVFLNSKNVSLRAKNINAQTVIYLTIEDELRLHEYYVYYFFDK